MPKIVLHLFEVPKGRCSSRRPEVSLSSRFLFCQLMSGVQSPALHPPHTQSTFLRSLRLPSVLIASPHLGGISTTISSYESLLLRGYSISSVLCLYQPYYRNHEFLSDYFAERGIDVHTIKTPPEKYGTAEEDAGRLEQWYGEVEKLDAGEDGIGGVAAAARWLEKEHEERIKGLDGMAERTMDSVWWPFTQHGLVSDACHLVGSADWQMNKKEDVMVVDSAYGDNFDAFYSKSATSSEPSPSSYFTSNLPSNVPANEESLLNSYFDGSASWFTCVELLEWLETWLISLQAIARPRYRSPHPSSS